MMFRFACKNKPKISEATLKNRLEGEDCVTTQKNGWLTNQMLGARTTQCPRKIYIEGILTCFVLIGCLFETTAFDNSSVLFGVLEILHD